MKNQLSLIAIAAALTLTAPLAHAGTPSKAKKQTAKRVAVTTVDYNTVTIRASQPQQSEWAGREIGNDAPHQERNPTAHPELFRYNP